MERDAGNREPRGSASVEPTTERTERLYCSVFANNFNRGASIKREGNYRRKIAVAVAVSRVTILSKKGAALVSKGTNRASRASKPNAALRP